MKQRIQMYDGLKFFALFFVYSTHFIAYFHEAYFVHWTKIPEAFLLNGITGKFGVAIFGVLLSYFAYEKGENNGAAGFPAYILKRYNYFVFCGLFINMLYKIEQIRMRGTFSIGDIELWLKVSFTLGDDLYPTFWCLKYFFVVSTLAYLLGAYKSKISTKIIICLVLGLTMDIWIAIFLLGILVSDILEAKELYKGKKTQLLLVVLIMVMFRGQEGIFTYLRDGITALLIIAFLNVNKGANAFLSQRIFSKIGMRSMGVFMIHPMVYSYVSPRIFQMLSDWPYGVAFITCLGMTFILVVLIAVPIDWLVKKMTTITTANIIISVDRIGKISNETKD